MRRKCEEFVLQLKRVRLDLDYPMAQGIRPSRKGDVRVEKGPHRMMERQAVSSAGEIME